MPRTLSNINRRILASFLGMLLLVMLLLLASLEGGFDVKPPPKIALHEVRSLSLPAPPLPPSPPMKQQGGGNSPRPSLARARVEHPVELDVMDLETDSGASSISGIGTGGLGNGIGQGEGNGIGDGSGGWEIVGLGELDTIPMVRSASIMSYPQEAIKQNIQEFEVEIHIVIDEEGRTYPIRILKNPFPSMNNEVMKYASTVIFTPPTKLGVPVKTEYLWPLLMKKPLIKEKP